MDDVLSTYIRGRPSSSAVHAYQLHHIATETDDHSSDDTLHFVGAVGACWSQQASHLRVKRQLEKYMNTSFVDVCGQHSLTQMKCQNSSLYCRMSTLL